MKSFKFINCFRSYVKGNIKHKSSKIKFFIIFLKPKFKCLFIKTGKNYKEIEKDNFEMVENEFDMVEDEFEMVKMVEEFEEEFHMVEEVFEMNEAQSDPVEKIWLLRFRQEEFIARLASSSSF